MSAALVDDTAAWDVSLLRAAGFRGFHAVSHLRRTACLEVPVERGVYVVVRDTEAPPEFLERSPAPRYRGEEPSVAVDVLAERWVPGARLLYVGRARGPGVRSLLRQRIKRYLRFGQGRVVGHWGGRLVWQLRDHAALRLAWRATPDEEPGAVETTLLDGFSRRYGARPFANFGEEEDE